MTEIRATVDKMNEEIKYYTHLSILINELIETIKIARDGVISSSKIEEKKEQIRNLKMQINEGSGDDD